MGMFTAGGQESVPAVCAHVGNWRLHASSSVAPCSPAEECSLVNAGPGLVAFPH